MITLLLVVAGCVLVYAMLVAALVIAGRHSQARALAGFIPDCVVLLKRLLAEPSLPRHRKAVLALLLGYLLMPIDLVPDFIPVAGQLDDVLIAGLALRYSLRGGGPELLAEHWPGPPESLRAVMRVAFGSAAQR